MSLALRDDGNSGAFPTLWWQRRRVCTLGHRLRAAEPKI